jgi:signal transduction histidine kinase
MGNVQLARNRLQTLKQQVAEQPATVNHQVEQIQRLLENAFAGTRIQRCTINNLIDDVQIQTNTLDLYVQQCNLIDLVRESFEEQRQQAPERMIQLEIPSQEKTLLVLVDAERIRRVVATYLANALASSPADQPVTVRVTMEGLVVRVSVHDERLSIPSDEQAHVWERFHRAGGIATRNDLDKNEGIGLYLCRELIKRHYGQVGLQSVPGSGTTFYFTLPLLTP